MGSTTQSTKIFELKLPLTDQTTLLCADCNLSSRTLPCPSLHWWVTLLQHFIFHLPTDHVSNGRATQGRTSPQSSRHHLIPHSPAPNCMSPPPSRRLWYLQGIFGIFSWHLPVTHQAITWHVTMSPISYHCITGYHVILPTTEYMQNPNEDVHLCTYIVHTASIAHKTVQCLCFCVSKQRFTCRAHAILRSIYQKPRSDLAGGALCWRSITVSPTMFANNWKVFMNTVVHETQNSVTMSLTDALALPSCNQTINGQVWATTGWHCVQEMVTVEQQQVCIVCRKHNIPTSALISKTMVTGIHQMKFHLY